ncbi:MAG TPA: NUDIX domain-containing protein [Bacillota bacterium]|nr:NUDIX domain-containing protein [Bacillota bacterium]
MTHFGISTHSIILQDHQFLVTKRPPTAKFGANRWDTPGGTLDIGEQPETGLAREILEETGLTVTVDKPVIVHSKMVLEKDKQLIYLIFLCHYVTGEVKLSNEHTEYRWVTREQALELPLVDYLQRALEEMDLSI